MLELCANLGANPPLTSQIYPSICSQINNCFGPVIYSTLIKSISVEGVFECEPHVVNEAAFSQFIKQSLQCCSSIDLQLLATAVSVRLSSRNGSDSYTVKHPSKGVIRSFDLPSLLCKVFQLDFLALYQLSNTTLMETFLSENFKSFNVDFDNDVCILIFIILKGRGYPESILTAILSEISMYVSHLPHHRFLDRKQARIQRVANEFKALESANES